MYSAYILPTMLYGSECWMFKKADAQRIDALDQWCLQRTLDIRWHDFIRNDAVCRMTQQPPLSSTVKSPLFGYVARMNELANRILSAQPPDNWTNSRGGHAPPGSKVFAVTCPHSAESCEKPGRQLRTDLSGSC